MGKGDISSGFRGSRAGHFLAPPLGVQKLGGFGEAASPER